MKMITEVSFNPPSPKPLTGFHALQGLIQTQSALHCLTTEMIYPYAFCITRFCILKIKTSSNAFVVNLAVVIPRPHPLRADPLAVCHKDL